MAAALAGIADREWYHGSITRQEAEARLAHQPVGTFLFRESETRPDSFSLSVRGPDKIKHFMVKEENGSYILVGKPSEFLTVDALVKFYAINPTSTTDGTCLLQACPRSAQEPPLIPARQHSFASAAEPEVEESNYVALADQGKINAQVLSEVRDLADKKKKDKQVPPTLPATPAPPPRSRVAYEDHVLE